MNRAVGRRSFFEGRADFRFFLAQVARAVRRGEIEVHAFCVIINHFHLLVRSPVARLSHALRHIERDYVPYFNRRHRCDGPLVRTRFRSKRVGSLIYRRALVRYIDHNPRKAGLCVEGQIYPFGSEYCYLRRDGPIWLSREWVEHEARVASGARGYEPADYYKAFPPHGVEIVEALVEGRLAHHGDDADVLDDLVCGSPERVREWMERRAAVADKVRPAPPLAPPSAVKDVVESCRKRHGAWPLGGPRSPCGWERALVALLRELCRMSFEDIALHVGASPSTVGYRYRAHRRMLPVDPTYSRRIGLLASCVLRVCHDQASCTSRVTKDW